MSKAPPIAMTDFGAGPSRKFIVHSNEVGRVFKRHFNRVFHVEHRTIKCSVWNISLLDRETVIIARFGLRAYFWASLLYAPRCEYPAQDHRDRFRTTKFQVSQE